MFVRVKMAAGAGPHDCRTRQPRKKFHPEELRECGWDCCATYVQLFAANQCSTKFNKFNAVSGVLAGHVR